MKIVLDTENNRIPLSSQLPVMLSRFYIILIASNTVFHYYDFLSSSFINAHVVILKIVIRSISFDPVLEQFVIFVIKTRLAPVWCVTHLIQVIFFSILNSKLAFHVLTTFGPKSFSEYCNANIVRFTRKNSFFWFLNVY